MKHSDVLHTQSIQQSSFPLARPLSTSCPALHIAGSWFTVARTQRTQLATLILTRQEHSHQPIEKTAWARPDRVVGIYRPDRKTRTDPCILYSCSARATQARRQVSPRTSSIWCDYLGTTTVVSRRTGWLLSVTDLLPTSLLSTTPFRQGLQSATKAGQTKPANFAVFAAQGRQHKKDESLV